MLDFVKSMVAPKQQPIPDFVDSVLLEDGFHYETVHIDQMEYDRHMSLFRYPCPCGDLFEIAVDDLLSGERVALCPTCSLTILIDDDVEVAAYVEKRIAEEN